MDIQFLRANAQLPTLGSEWAAGYDLYAATELVMLSDGSYEYKTIEIPPHETRMIPTGIALSIPKGHWGGIYARSGLATKLGLRPANCVGVIDSDYRGEIFVALHNDTDGYRYIHNGTRIAQLIFHQTIRPINGFKQVEELDTTNRGSGGFGSTGQ